MPFKFKRLQHQETTDQYWAHGKEEEGVSSQTSFKNEYKEHKGKTGLQYSQIHLLKNLRKWPLKATREKKNAYINNVQQRKKNAFQMRFKSGGGGENLPGFNATLRHVIREIIKKNVATAAKKKNK